MKKCDFYDIVGSQFRHCKGFISNKNNNIIVVIVVINVIAIIVVVSHYFRCLPQFYVDIVLIISVVANAMSSCYMDCRRGTLPAMFP